MSSFSITFNATQVAPNTGSMQVFETGIYDVVLVGSGEKPVKDKPQCAYAQMEMQITAGPSKGGKIIDRLNLKSDSQQAVDIAYGQLSAYCHVIGVIHIQQSLAELHGKPFKVDIVKEERADKPGTFSNNVRRLLDVQGREPGQQNVQQGVQQSVQQPQQVVQQPQQPIQQQPQQATAIPQQFVPAGQQAPQQFVQTPQSVQQPQQFAPAGQAVQPQQAVQQAQPQPQQNPGNATPSWAQ